MSIKTTPYGFIPTQVSGCSLWLDAADSSTVTLSGSTATQWNDKSGNERNSTSCSATYSNRINGLSCMTNPIISGPITNSGSSIVTIFIVGTKASTGGLYDNMLALNLSPITNYYGAGTLFACYYGGTSPPQFYCYMSGNLSLSFVGAVNTPFIFNAFQTGTTGSTYGNGTSYGDVGTAGSTFNYTTYYIGACTGGPAWIGNIGEIIVYNSILSISQRQQVESYLAQKWGIRSSLPVAHPGLTSSVYQSSYLKTAGVKRNIATMTPFYTGFTPRQISGLALWLDAADSSTITLVTGVSQWNDKSGNGYNLTQGSTGSQPTRTGNLLNFVTNYNMNIPQAAINNASTWSMFFAVNPIASVNWFMAKQRDGVNSYNIFSTTQTGGPGPNAYFTGLTNYLYVRMFNAGTLAASSAALTMSQLQILSFVYDGTNMLIYINGNLSSTTAGSFAIQNDTSSTNFLLGQWFGNGTNYNSNGNFQLGELIYFNTSLIATQRQQVESYLAQKWGLVSSLPGGHLHLTQPAGARTALSLANSKMSIISRRITAFTSFRWTITVGNTETYIQISEFQVGFNNTQVVFVSPSISTSGTPNQWYGPEPAPAAVDNNIGSKALALAVPALFTVTVASPITVNMYRWASANDSTPSRNPTQWTVDGSADGVTFVRLHTQNTTYAGPNTTFTYTSWINFTY